MRPSAPTAASPTHSGAEGSAEGGGTSSRLTLRVGEFEGPFDLLLHLCRSNEVDLVTLPVRTITDQYLAHLEALEFQDLEAAGAYLVMAATLIYLKSKLLVPSDEAAEELDDEAEAVRHELEERLRAYARIKTLGAWLAAREAEQALVWGRGMNDVPAPDDVPLEDLSVHLLERAFRRLVEEQVRRRPREIQPEPLSMLDRMTEILAVLRDTWSLLFSSVVGADGQRAEIVVTLLAVLELTRLGNVRTRQGELFGEIVIERRPDAPMTLGAPASEDESQEPAT